jgi:hypothetical protein
MKYLIILLMLFAIIGTAFSQEYYEYTADHLFDNNLATFNGTAGSVDDSVAFNSTLGYYELKGTAAADTFISQQILLTRGGNDITVYCGLDSAAGTTNAPVQFGYYRGPELGWAWTTMATFAAEGASTTFKVPGQTFEDEVLQHIGIRILESGAQRNNYWFRIKTFRWR